MPAPALITAARVTALGLATGARSTAGAAALAWTSGHADPDWLGSAQFRWAATVAAAGELVGDQLPRTPSRLTPGPLAARLAAAALGGAVLARGRGGLPVLMAATLGAGAAFAGARLGAGWRAWAAPKLGGDHPGALIEDAVTAGLAAGAVVRR